MSDIEPDTKDWTWTIDTACPECGLDAAAVTVADLPAALRAGAHGWDEALSAPDATTRAQPGRWSTVEYAGHVRDVCRLFAERTHLMLRQTEPGFADWDGEAAAADYAAGDPARVARQVAESIEAYAAAHDGLDRASWERGGVRSDGERFTVTTLARYGLHEVCHHAWDVGIDRRD